MWNLVDFLICWMVLPGDARRLIHAELGGWDRLRVGRLEYKDPRGIGV